MMCEDHYVEEKSSSVISPKGMLIKLVYLLYQNQNIQS